MSGKSESTAEHTSSFMNEEGNTMTITSFKGAGATTYAKAMEILVKRGDSLDELNSANHYALEQGRSPWRISWRRRECSLRKS